MLCLGIDPDMHDTAIASWDDRGPVAAHVVSIPKKLTGTDALLAMMHELSKPWPTLARFYPFGYEGPDDQPSWCAVEGQEWVKARGVGGQSIVHLGNVAGLCVMRVARGYLHGCGLYWPKPAEWKGSVPKHAMQARLYTELGWGYQIVGKGSSSYAVPLLAVQGFNGFTSEWKHVGDALLLARWCWEQAQGRKWTSAA
jgi:hypothetical protein